MRSTDDDALPMKIGENLSGEQDRRLAGGLEKTKEAMGCFSKQATGPSDDPKNNQGKPCLKPKK